MSIGGALSAGKQWRLQALWLLALGVPALATVLPLGALLHPLLDHAPQARALLQWLDLQTIQDLTGALRGRSEWLAGSLAASGALALLASPAVTGATIAAIRAPERLSFAGLLRGAGESYFRLLRVLAFGLVPLGAAGAGMAAAIHWAHKRGEQLSSETEAARLSRFALLGGLLLVYLAHVLVDLARAHLAADERRRSALGALLSGLGLLLRRPLRAVWVAVLASLPGLALAAIATLLRLRLEQRDGRTLLEGFALAQLALVGLGWERASRLFALTGLVADEARRRAAGPARTAAGGAAAGATSSPASPPTAA